MKLYIPKEEDYFKSYSKELEQYIEKLEHENERIYTKLDEKDKEIESWIKLFNYNEIEDIPQYIEDLEVDNKSLKQENKILNSIIKEVREYIESNFDKSGVCVSGSDLPYSYIDELLEILDKENKDD